MNLDRMLEWSSKHGHTEIVRMLLETGICSHSWTNYALVVAELHEHTEAVQLIIEHIRRSS